MTLSTGTRLSHYEISSQLGKGGMGEVYKAKDQKLGRDVAIKVLPEEFAKDADRVARFQREAKLLASLNHPNIAAIHGLEESEGTHFLVLELIEGDTLADRLKRGAIPVEEALKLALQIAEALEAAHEKGVIHRDLKPANIKVTPDGKVKVLDFGLAKAFAGDQGDMSLSNSPTLSVAATQQGVILGTAAYMSPEQARGNPVDKRADIWAFGVVLFEILTGRRIFSEDTVSDTLASVLKTEPDWRSLPPNLHPRIRFLLERCLKKNPKDRYSGISDARVEIQEVLADPSGVFVQPSVQAEPKKRVRLRLSWFAVGIALASIIVGVAVWILKPAPPPEPKQVTRFDYQLPESQGFSAMGFASLAISADGTKIVYVANRQLYLKNSDEFVARPIQGTDEDPIFPHFSPDGQWVGYFARADNQLKKIDVGGGSPVIICDVDDPIGATWGTDDMVVFGTPGGIMQVSANGGIPKKIIEGEESRFYLFPQTLPDGKSVLFTIFMGQERQVVVQSLETGEQKELFPGYPAQYVSTGHIVYGLENSLFAIRFDLDALETIGGPVPLVEGVFRANLFSPTQSAISDSGTLVYMPGRMGALSQSTLVWVDHEGKEESIEGEPRVYDDVKISPDGMRVALSFVEDGNTDIHIYDLVRKTMSRFTFNEGEDSDPVWTPDGERIVFYSERDEERGGIYWKAADGAGKVEYIASIQNGSIWPTSISSDGNSLLLGQGGAGLHVGVLSMEGDHTPKLLLQEEYAEISPQISPDGRWIAYASNESGEFEIYLRPYPDVDRGQRQVSTKGGTNPLWSPDGKELYYRGPDAIMAVSVETDPIFRLGNPERLFSDESYRGRDIHPDGKRFLMIKEIEAPEDESIQGSPHQINIVLNWFEELKERIPVD